MTAATIIMLIVLIVLEVDEELADWLAGFERRKG